MQRKHKTALGAILAATLMGLGSAQAQYTAIVAAAPPPPHHEVIPAPRHGLVWAPGHYDWRGNQYVWVSGRWLRDRPGYEYREPRWVQRGNGEWILVGNSWERRGPRGDRDRDGVANRYDRDRDGDGVSNRYDRFPNNPRRS